MLDVHRAVDLPTRPDDRRMLIEGLWSDEAVGILGGEPKCGKSFLALDLAVAVASGRPCLRRFRVPQPGRVVLFAGEDAPHEVRRRLAGIASAAGLDLATLEVYVITAPVVRLDRAEHCRQLEETVAALKPRLLVLDPFVRMHRIDENVAAEVAPLLAYLRELQRRHHTAVLLVHHSRKGAAHIRGGQALRGSSELHAWGDSNLYLRRKDAGLWLTVEHRAAPSPAGLPLELTNRGEALSLEIKDSSVVGPPTAVPRVADRIEQVLTQASGPLGVTELRSRCRIRTETLCKSLAQMASQGVVEKIQGGYRISSAPTEPTAASRSQPP